MSEHAKEYLSTRRRTSNNIDRKTMARRRKMMKMKQESDRKKEKEKEAIEKKKMKMRKKLAKYREKEEKKKKAVERKQSSSSEKKENKKRSVYKPKTIPNTRLTEPKKRSLLRRVMLQMKYNGGAFDYIEDEYDDLTRREMEEYRTSNYRSDRKYYKEVQQYEDATDDVTVKKGWTAFKAGLIAVTLTGMVITAGVLHHDIMKSIHDNAPQPVVMITLDEASQEQIDIAMTDMNLIKDNSEYSFENLTQEEQIDAVLRIPVVEDKIGLGAFKNSLMNFKDQELLNQIVEEAFGEEYSTYSQEKKDDLRKLAYELLEGEKKGWTRDPVKVMELMEKQEAERIEREAKQAEVDAILSRRAQNNDNELDDFDDR